MTERPSFAAKKIVFDEVPNAYGAVICANGELRPSDHCIPAYNYGNPSRCEWTEIWDAVADDELAVEWEWHHGHYQFKVALLPQIITTAHRTVAKLLANEIMTFHAVEIDWADDYIWRCNPTGGRGWELEPLEELDTAVLLAMVEEANRSLSDLPDLNLECPYANLYLEDGAWFIQIGDDVSGYGTKEAMTRDSVERFLQKARDYTCHCLVVERRRDLHWEYFRRYEALRPAVEQDGSYMVNLGVDGYCVMGNGNVLLYAYKDGDIDCFEHLYS